MLFFLLLTETEHRDDDDDVPLGSSLNVSPKLTVKEFRDHMVDKHVPEQTIRASHDSNILRDMFRYLKSRQFNLSNFVLLTRKEEVQGRRAMTAKQKLWVVYA